MGQIWPQKTLIYLSFFLSLLFSHFLYFLFYFPPIFTFFNILTISFFFFFFFPRSKIIGRPWSSRIPETSLRPSKPYMHGLSLFNISISNSDERLVGVHLHSSCHHLPDLYCIFHTCEHMKTFFQHLSNVYHDRQMIHHSLLKLWY